MTDKDGKNVGVEFAITSVLSPGGERYFSLTPELARQIEPKLTYLAKDLEYCNLNDRGFTVVTFTPQDVTAEYLYVNTVTDRNYKVNKERSRTFRVTAKDPGKIEAVS